MVVVVADILPAVVAQIEEEAVAAGEVVVAVVIREGNLSSNPYHRHNF